MTFQFVYIYLNTAIGKSQQNIGESEGVNSAAPVWIQDATHIS